MSRVNEVFLFVCVLVTIDLTQGGGVRDFSGRMSLQNALLSYLCQSGNGIVCNGQGQCFNGRCSCNADFTGPKCENFVDPSGLFGDILNGVTRVLRSDFGLGEIGNPEALRQEGTAESGPEIMACFGNNDGVCNGHGVCVNGTCLCEPDWAGITCELQNRNGFCETYKSCAECTALLKTCPASCPVSAKFQLVSDFPISGGTFYRCRYKNVENDCTYTYQLASTSRTGVKTIMVKTCLKYRSSTPAFDADDSASTKQEMTTSRQDMTSISTKSQTTTLTKDDDQDFCEKYRECAECTALLTKCPTKCTNMATFNLVYGFPTNSGSFYRCRVKNVERDCSFYFQLDETKSANSDKKIIMVKSCLKYPTITSSTASPKSTPKTPQVTSQDDVISDDEDDENKANRSDRNKGGEDDDSGAQGLTTFESVNIFVLLSLIRFMKTMFNL